MATENITVAPMNGDTVNFEHLVKIPVVGLGVLHWDYLDSELDDSLVDPSSAPGNTAMYCRLHSPLLLGLKNN
jgi:hypothetical protein